MVKLEYIDTIRYEAGSPKSIFLLADMDQASDRHIAIFGVGLEAFFIHQYLTKKGYLVDCFLDNNPNMAGRFFCEKPINLPNAI